MKPFDFWVAWRQHEEREFILALLGSLVFYAFLVLIIHAVQVPERPQEDFREMPRHIAKLILEAPKAPPIPHAQAPGQTAPAIPKAEDEAPEKKAAPGSEQPEIPPAAEVSPAPPPPAPDPGAQARERLRRNREIAMQSGLLRLLTQEGEAVTRNPSTDEKLKKVFAPSTALKAIEAPPERVSGDRAINKEGSGGIDNLIAALQQQGRAGDSDGLAGGIGNRRSARVDSPFEILGSQGREATRSYDSIREVVDSLNGWIRFVYNRSLRRDPTLRGTVTIEFNILPEGGVSECRIVSSTLNDPELEDQLVRRFLQLKFPPAAGGVNTVVYPITLVPSG